jgi:hypothetical protein
MESKMVPAYGIANKLPMRKQIDSGKWGPSLELMEETGEIDSLVVY